MLTDPFCLHSITGGTACVKSGEAAILYNIVQALIHQIENTVTHLYSQVTVRVIPFDHFDEEVSSY